MAHKISQRAFSLCVDNFLKVLSNESRKNELIRLIYMQHMCLIAANSTQNKGTIGFSDADDILKPSLYTCARCTGDDGVEVVGCMIRT